MIWDNTCTGANWNPSWTFKFATCWLLWFDQLLWDCLISFITFDYFGKDQLFSFVPWRPSLCFCALGKSISCMIWHFLDFDQIGTIGAFLDSNIFNGTHFFQRWPCDLKTFKKESKQLWALILQQLLEELDKTIRSRWREAFSTRTPRPSISGACLRENRLGKTLLLFSTFPSDCSASCDFPHRW